MSRLSYLEHKIVSLKKAVQLSSSWKFMGEKVVFTNGCFDILHNGHVTYLAKAAEFGNKLIIGLNTDASVKRQGKGEDRPVNSEFARARVLAALGVVDLVVLFDGDTPLELIEALEPNVLVKGADYDPEERDKTKKTYIVGSDFVRAKGGEVRAVDIEAGFSSTSIIQKLKS